MFDAVDLIQNMDGYAMGRGLGVILGMLYCLGMSALLMYNIQNNPLVVSPPCS